MANFTSTDFLSNTTDDPTPLHLINLFDQSSAYDHHHPYYHPQLPPSDEAEDPNLDLLSSVRFIVQRLLVPPVTLIGLLGNLLTIVVMLQRRMSTSSTTHNYLAALAASDALHLLADFFLSLKHYPSFKCDQTAVQRAYWRSFPALIFFTDYTFNTAVWLTVCFTIERYIVIRFPIRGKVLCTTSRALKVILLTAMVCFALTLPTFLENRTVLSIPKKSPPFESSPDFCPSAPENSTEFYPITSTELATAHRRLFTVFYPVFSTIAFTFVPIAILAIFNLFLIRSVRKSSQKRRRWIAEQQKTIYSSVNGKGGGKEINNNNTLPKVKSSPPPPSSSPSISLITTGSLVFPPPTSSAASSPSANNKNSRHSLKPKSRSLIRLMTSAKMKWPPANNSKNPSSNTFTTPSNSNSSSIPPTCRLLLRQDAHITRLLIAVVLFFLVCLLPTALVTIYQSSISQAELQKRRRMLQVLGNVCNLLVSINSAGNFTLYCLLSRKYRRTLVDLIGRLMRRGGKK